MHNISICDNANGNALCLVDFPALNLGFDKSIYEMFRFIFARSEW